MKPLLIGVLLAGVLGAQTEVRHAIVLPSYKDLKYAPLPPINPPVPAEVTLSNGMKVFMLEDHELPLVSGTALIRTGNLFDPKGKIGLAGLTGDVLRAGGTTSKTGDQLDVELENIAASVESQIGESSGTLRFSCLKENTAQVLRVFKDLLTAPEFREDKLDLAKTQLRSEISRRNDDAHGIAEREFSDILYGRDNSYGWQMEYSDVDNIQRQDLLNFYRRYYFPANIQLEIYGDFSTAEMKATLEQLLGEWKYSQAPVPPFPKVPEKAEPGIFLATKTDVTQTFLDVGHLGGVLRDKDYPALEVAAEILGGSFSSRLFRNVRTEHGWAYSIGASWGAQYDHPGLFHISGSTQSAHTVDTLKAVRDELDRIRTSEVTDQELQTAKDTVLNGFVFNFDRPSKTLNRLIVYEYYGYPRDFIFQYQKAVAAVTKADVLRVAKQYFRPQDLSYIAVGNPKDFGTPLSALDLKISDIDLSIPEPKQETSQTDPASLEKGKDLLRRAQQSLGGSEKLAAVKDLQYQADVDVQTPGGPPMKVKQTNSFLMSGVLRQESELPFGKQSLYSDGKSGWLAGMQGVQNLPAAVLKQARGEMFRQILALSLSDRDPDRAVNYAGDGVLEISSKDGESVRLQVDEKTGVPLKLTYQEAGPQGPASIDLTYSDWREVAGVRLPFEWTVVQGGQKFAVVKIQDYKINSGLTQEALSKKP
ncbi:MAG: insulinase family protein [Acidobacteriia bacterium]|nr:insulinase family protein [Terriglobia bacterium]